MRLISLQSALASLLLAGLVAIPFLNGGHGHASGSFLEVGLKSEKTGTIQVFFEEGSGLNEHDSVRLPVSGGNRPAILRFPLPEARISALRIDPIDKDGEVTIQQPRLVNEPGENFVRCPSPN